MDSAREILDKADVLVNDPWYMRVGGALYQHEIPTKNIPTFLMNLSEIPTREFFEMSKEIIVGTKNGEAIIQKLISDAEYNDGYDTFQNDLVQKQGSDKELVTDDYFTEQELEEAAYPSNFNMEEFKLLTSFAARVRYCAERLPRLGSGSARIVYKIDEGTVLKLAKNGKGIAQNEEEERAYGDDIFPKIFDSDINSTWLISEFVLPAKAQDFKYCFGMTFQEFVSFIYACGGYRFQKRNLICSAMEEEKWLNLLETNEDLAAFDDYIGNYGSIVVGDMARLCNYGLTQRNGETHIVLLDSGLTEYVWDNYYRRR
jgi:hypothetical protein